MLQAIRKFLGQEVEKVLAAQSFYKSVPEQSGDQRQATYLGDGLILAQTRWGGHVVVPGYNIDVAIGIVRDGMHEAWTTRLVQELLQAGQTYINVGANFGYYTCLGGRIVGNQGKVIAIEANPHVFPILMKTIMWGGIVDRVSAYNRAAHIRSGERLDFAFDYQYMGGGSNKTYSDDDSKNRSRSKGHAQLPFWRHDTIPAFLDKQGKWLVGGSSVLLNTFQIPSLMLDEITEGISVDLIQCDVEHAEPYVLLGAQKLLQRSPNCRLIFEWEAYAYRVGNDEYKDSVKKMWAMLQDLGFRVRHLVPRVCVDGSIMVSHILSFDDFIQGEHGDYVAVRAQDDPWQRL